MVRMTTEADTANDGTMCIITGTAEQNEAYLALVELWHDVGLPSHGIGLDGCWMVTVTNESGYSMQLGIERDGYTHS